jgi:uncharacterized protein YeaO (DUF488 family)
MRELAPSKELLSWCKTNNECQSLDPARYYRTWRTWYVGEMIEHYHLIEELRDRHEAGETIALLCGCHDAAKCHRSVLASLILESDSGPRWVQ